MKGACATRGARRIRFAAILGLLSVISAIPAFSAPSIVAPAMSGSAQVGDYVMTSPPLAVCFDVQPTTLNLKSSGMWINAMICIPEGYTCDDIDVSSILLNGTVPVDLSAPMNCVDGKFLHVKFNRMAVELILPQGEAVPVTVTGDVGADTFEGTDYIRVIKTVVTLASGAQLMGGTSTQVLWDPGAGRPIQSVALLASYDGGGTWDLIASGQPNTGSYTWDVPNIGTQTGRVAVVLVEESDDTGYVVDGVFGVSGEFSIQAVTGVGDRASAELALRGLVPNPATARSELRVSFSLKSSNPATLAMYDLSGRRVAMRRVDGLGPGWHTVPLGLRAGMAAGVYVVRLTQDGQSLSSRAILIP